MTFSAFGWAFTLLFSRRRVFGFVLDVALVAFNAIEVIGVLAPQLDAVFVFRCFGIALFADVTFGTQSDFSVFASGERFGCHRLVVSVMAEDTIRIAVVFLVSELYLSPFFVNRRYDDIVAWEFLALFHLAAGSGVAG